MGDAGGLRIAFAAGLRYDGGPLADEGGAEQYRVATGRAPHAPRLVPAYGPEALGHAVRHEAWDPASPVRWVQSVPAVRVEMLNVVDVEAREV